MNEMEARMQIYAQMTQKYGIQEGSRAAGVISDPILKDFRNMLKQSGGRTVSEEYRLEDGTGVIRVTGKSGPRNEPDFLTIEIIRY